MREQIKNHLVNLLFKLLDAPAESGEKDEVIDQWLAWSWQQPGFRKYIAMRDKKIIRELAGGVGLVGKERSDYTRMIGQRFEALLFGNNAKKAFIIEERKRKEAEAKRKK